MYNWRADVRRERGDGTARQQATHLCSIAQLTRPTHLCSPTLLAHSATRAESATSSDANLVGLPCCSVLDAPASTTLIEETFHDHRTYFPLLK